MDYSVNGAVREGNIYVLQCVEGGTPMLKSVKGETPSRYIEGGTPFESEGATPTMCTEGEIPGKSKGETQSYLREKSLKNLSRRLRYHLRGKPRP